MQSSTAFLRCGVRSPDRAAIWGRALLAHYRRHCRRHCGPARFRLAGHHGIGVAVLHCHLGDRHWAHADRGAIQLRKEIEGEWLLILSGLLSVALGLLLLVRPGLGALAVVWMIGWFAILEGCLLVALSLRLRKHKHMA